VELFPAIDLLGGKAVRLAEGDRTRATVYSDRPDEVAAAFTDAGATNLHVVDLDGAFCGAPVQREAIQRIFVVAAARGCRVQVGGGLRTAEAVEAALDAGAARVVVGTLAVREPETTRALCRAHPSRIVVAVDGRGDKVAVDGWRDGSTTGIDELSHAAAHWGAAAILYTDVARDGLQVGPAVERTAALQDSLGDRIDVIASGGIASLDDLERLATAGIRGAVVGRALYEHNFTLEEALARC
jgi:phosphoribosylformimino-5-aminoimidazole carboxamide ribotide isomerase